MSNFDFDIVVESLKMEKCRIMTNDKIEIIERPELLQRSHMLQWCSLYGKHFIMSRYSLYPDLIV